MTKNLKRIILLNLCLSWCFLAMSQNECYRVVPLPSQINATKAKPFMLNSATTISISSPQSTDIESLSDCANFLKQYIYELSGLDINISSKSKNNCISLELKPEISGDEAYRIIVGEKSVRIQARTTAGLFYGVQTLRKSIANIVPEGSKPQVIEMPAVEINDAPRFAYRGMMLDCSRHFFSIDFIKTFIDMLALHGMNNFHWHLSDDQGWRIEIKKYPRLTSFGAWRTGTVVGYNSMVDDSLRYGGYYTQDEARQIVAYAAKRHINVIPEIDMPGHMKAALAAYPELGCKGHSYEVGHRWGVYLDILCMGNEQVYTFCQDVLGEIMDIFPSKLIHIGGDEAPKEVFRECPKCQALMAREGLTADNCQGYFTNRIEQYVNSRGRSIVGWDEILDGNINPSATIHAWRGIDYAAKAAAKGHNVILSSTSHCYFDYTQIAGDMAHHEPSNVNPGLTVEKVYQLDPLPEGTSDTTRSHILGVQANIWTEYIASANHVEYMAMPRMAAIAEVGWCQAAKDYADFTLRLGGLTRLYRQNHYVYARHLWPEELRSPWDDE